MTRFGLVSTLVFVVVALGCSAGAGSGRDGRGRGGSDGGGGGGGDGATGTDGGPGGGIDGGPGGGRDSGGPALDDAGRPTCGSAEFCGDGLDNDCNGIADDGCACDPGETQSCYDGPPGSAGVGTCSLGTQACTGGSEFGEWTPCEGAIQPADEICGDDLDNDCDGTVDDGCGCDPGTTRSCYTGPGVTADVGECRSGMQTCLMMGSISDWGPCMDEVLPRPEVCDGRDRDCDGVANTGCECVVGTTRSCYTGPAGTAGVGICREGAQDCVSGPGGTGSMWGPCVGEVLPEPDTCDGVDHTCTGMPGAGCPCIIGTTRGCYTGPAGTRMVGACRDGSQTCRASGGSAAWDATCRGETRPVAEVCGNRIDDDCDGAVDEGCGGMLTCPGDITIPAGDPVVLTAMGAGLSGYTWTITAAPAGGAATAIWAPAPPTAMTETFTPYIVGVYTIRVTARDSTGATLSCMFNVTALPHGLRVQVRWDGAGDVDLHLHNGTTTPWFSTNDCYYANTATTWGAVLDFDNTTADGPENIVVDTPALGMTYTVGVHNYARSAGRRATIEIFCGDTSTTPVATYTSRALSGTAAGNCTANDFWKVASVVFTSSTMCTVTPVNTYTPSTTQCAGF